MRIVVSGTHGSGKSTLVADFVAAHPEFELLPDPFEVMDAADDEPDAAVFFTQLRIAADRLRTARPDARLVAERGPLDFLAYLDALNTLRRPTRSAELFRRGIPVTAAAMAHVDLLVLLPLNGVDDIDVPEEEDLELRAAMDEALLELADDPDLIATATVVEITGAPARRREQLEAAIATLR